MLERQVPGVPMMEGKSLALGYCSDIAGDDSGDNGNPDIIVVDFRSGQTGTLPASSARESLLSALDSFIRGDGAVEWHDAAKGLVAVRNILAKLKNGATIMVTPDFEFSDDDEDLTEGVRYDLEELEKILVGAQTARVRFHLAFDV